MVLEPSPILQPVNSNHYIKMASPQPGSPPLTEQYTPPAQDKEGQQEEEVVRDQPAKKRGRGRPPKAKPTFKCSTCAETFKNLSALRSHKLSAHAKDPSTSTGVCTLESGLSNVRSA
ncbi:hypothetical protein INR49_013761 [Caranx melampygus]|nr:hypothetical protein INR49_013761 [Caranx melampygus]